MDVSSYVTIKEVGEMDKSKRVLKDEDIKLMVDNVIASSAVEGDEYIPSPEVIKIAIKEIKGEISEREALALIKKFINENYLKD